MIVRAPAPTPDLAEVEAETTLTGQALKVRRVKADESAMEWAAMGGGGGGNEPPPVTAPDLSSYRALTADHTVGAFWATFDGSAVVTLSDGTNTITGTIANGTSDATHIDVGGGMNNSNESALQVLVVWLMINYIAGNIDVRPIYQYLYPYVEFGQLRLHTGETVGLTTRSGAGAAAITLSLPPACAGALALV